jgi:hypothetical protein
MTIGDEAEIRRTSVSTKVLMVGCGVLAVLGSFWGIVWFIRTYVEAPRVTLAPTMALAARDSVPAVPPKAAVAPAPASTAAQQAAASPPAVIMAETTPTGSVRADSPPASGGIADRWAPMAPATPPQAEPPPAAAPQAATPATLSPTPPETDPAAHEVAESAVPAISGAAPLPRRKPTQTASIKPRTAEPPLPRPRPDGPAPQSVWTAVPTTDDRFPQQ